MIKVGCDPEIIVIKHGRPISATELLRFHQDVYVGEGTLVGGIGTDGAGIPAEVRPQPSIQPRQVVQNLRLLLRHLFSHVAAGEMRLYVGAAAYLREEWGSSSQCTPVFGGHIHVSHRRMPAQALWLALVLAPILTATDILEDTYDGETRARTGYGDPYGYRWQGRGRIELRAPSAIWLAHPTLAEAYLSMVQRATWRTMHELVKHRDEYTFSNVVSEMWRRWGVSNYFPKLMLEGAARESNSQWYIRGDWRESHKYWSKMGEKHLKETLDYMFKVSRDLRSVKIFEFFAKNIDRLRRVPGIPLHKTWKLCSFPDEAECAANTCPGKGKVF